MSRIFFALMKKEYRVILKDWHSLAALFILPVIFVLFMSYALKDAANSSSNLNCSYFIDENNNQDLAIKFEKRMENIDGFSCKEVWLKSIQKMLIFLQFSQKTFLTTLKMIKI